MGRHRILVAGARGVVGRTLLDYFPGPDDWELIGLSRSPVPGRLGPHLSVDLLQPAACIDAIRSVPGITHLVYAAAIEQGSAWKAGADPSDVNTMMLCNLLDALDATRASLRHVTLIQGAKAYGSHLGAIETPARESDPRHLGANSFYSLEDHLRERQRTREWTWTILRPPTVIGFAVGTAGTRLLGSIATYATLLRERRLPLWFPGTNLDHVWQGVDARLLAEAIVWCSSTPAAANEVLNVTNGDCATWTSLWPQLARMFGMESAAPKPMSLSQIMGDEGRAWENVVIDRGLAPHSLEELASWRQADYVFNKASNVYLSTIKLRRVGFEHCIDTAEMFEFWIGELVRMKIIPPPR